MSGMLASVENLAEALLVLEAGADIIDLKSPSAGALGALPLTTVREIVQVLAGRRPVSASSAMRTMKLSSGEEATVMLVRLSVRP